MSVQDPFHIVKEEVEQTLASVENLFERWKGLVDSGNAHGNPEFDKLTLDLQKTVRSVDWDLGDLDETIRIVSENRARFALDDEEIARRKGFVRTTRERLEAIKQETKESAAALAAASRDALMAPAAGAVMGTDAAPRRSRLDDAIEEDNEAFIASEMQRQELVMRDQDVELEGVEQSVARIHVIGNEIHDELQTQEKMIDDLDRDVDRTGARLKRNIAKAAQVIRDAKDKGKMIIIVILIAFMVVLAIFLFK